MRKLCVKNNSYKNDEIEKKNQNKKKNETK